LIDAAARPIQNDAVRSLAVVVLALLVCQAAGGEEAYEIGPGDVLRVVVLGQSDMSGDMPVDSDGIVTFPILGKVKASDMTTKDLERKLTRLLADGYLKRPEVSVAVQEFRSQRVYVSGEVQRPGVYALKADRSLLALLGDVGSLTPGAGHEVVVTRPSKGPTPVAEPPASDGAPPTGEAAGSPPGAEVFHVNLDDLRAGKPEANILLQVGDSVHVPPAAQVFVSGHVGRPGAYRYQSGTTLLEVLTLAGGVTERGASGRTKVIRTIDGKKKQIKVEMGDPVMPGDTIIVPERFF
jgi:polysaccharide export outer membrane protein